jgi:hypothetical protein
MQRGFRAAAWGVLLAFLPVAEAASWSVEGSVAAGEVDTHGSFETECPMHLLWFWKVTVTLLDPQPTDSVLAAVYAVEPIPAAGAVVLTAGAPTTVFRGAGNLCILQLEIVGLTLASPRAYRLDWELLDAPDA